ncbi:MAG TPA: VCBS repeat-containing protein, partial [Thermoanaerobaculia bacterium]|nr:VCBS repeat-containing protein [Thermoanaerobaculia bacterium]
MLVLFAAARPAIADCPDFAGRWYPVRGELTFAIAKGDFNGDGIKDIAVTYSRDIEGTDGWLTIMMGGSDGLMHPLPTEYPIGPKPRGIAIGDLNGDGKLDLVVAADTKNYYCNSLPFCLHDVVGGEVVLLGNGDGTFRNGYASSGGHPYDVAVADFNGDGKPDLVVANGTTVSILLNRGDGTFGAPVNYAAGSRYIGYLGRYVAVGDFNRDGARDFAVSGTEGESVAVFLGNGHGGFSGPVNYPLGVESGPVEVADFNRDGRPDIAVDSR